MHGASSCSRTSDLNTRSVNDQITQEPLGRAADLTGSVFGELRVTGFAGRRGVGVKRQKIIYWNCICSCGAVKTVQGAKLRSGTTKSCGCSKVAHLRRHQTALTKPTGVSSLNSLYASYKWHAKQRGRVFNLTVDEFTTLTSGNCHYCSAEPAQHYKGNIRSNGYYVFNGIDRIDNSIGYTVENTRSCCKRCNYAKKAMSEDQFFEWVHRVADNWRSL